MSNIFAISHEDARPRFAIRFGVTGHRHFDGKQTADLETAVRRILSDFKAEMYTWLKRSDALGIYRPEPLMHLISALAMGADRIAARAALAEGATLSAALPMSATEYKRDFAPDDTEFDRLRSIATEQGAVTELFLASHHSEAERNQSYAQVGAYILRHSDLVIAIWDGKPARGTGGTANVVKAALEMGVPVIHIQSDNPGAISLLKGDRSVPCDATAISLIVGELALPTRQERSEADCTSKHDRKQLPDQLKAAAAYFRDPVAAPSGLQDSFLYEGPFKAKPYWLGALAGQIYPAWIARFKARIETKKKEPYTFTSRQTEFLFRHFQRADILATYYAQLHRSVFFLAYLLAGFALFAAFATLGIKAYGSKLGVEFLTGWFVGLELMLLFAILIIVDLERRFGWRDKWLNYRLLAELLRQSDILAVAGRPMPFRILQDLAADLPGRSWVGGAYCAIVRCAGIAPVVVMPTQLQALAAYTSKTRLQDQIEYHCKTSLTNDGAGEFMRKVSFFFFVLTIAAVAAKAVVMMFDGGSYHYLFFLSMAASVFPAAAYVFFAIRSQAEFEMVGRRSSRMLRRLSAVRMRIDAVRETSLTLDGLGDDILKSAAVMRHDAADWASIFDVKETEH
jgi:hypothetical protein